MSARTSLQSTTAQKNKLILRFSEDIQIAGGALNPVYITVTVNGKNRKIIKSQIMPLDHPSIFTVSQLALTLSERSLDSAKSVTVSYNPPTNGNNEGFITDLNDNPLASIATQVVDTFSISTNISKSGLSSAYKNLILGGTVAKGYGNTQNNTIEGNDSDNYIDGLGGSDTMIGGNGNETYIVNSSDDSIIENANEGTADAVRSSVNWTLGANIENLTLTGSINLSGTGNELKNVITGNSGQNILDGGAGDDTLIGGAGNDTYFVDSPGDSISDASGTETVVSSISWTLGPSLENLNLSGTDPITGIGNTLKNTIIGNSGNNILDGLTGTDILIGGIGADSFRFSTKPTFGTSIADHITDFNASEGDSIEISASLLGLTMGPTVRLGLSLTTVSNASALTKALGSASTLVYDSSNGNLYWNQNGNKSGFGTGGIFAVLDNKTALSSSNISLY